MNHELAMITFFPRHASLIAFLMLLLPGCATAPGAGMVSTRPYVEVSADPHRLTCNGRGPGDPFGSRMGRTPVLVAPGGTHSAWAEVVATATEWKDGARDCRNVSRLHVARGGGDHRVAFEQNPGAEGQTGNSLALIDWSPDGSRLLMELTLWTYPTDVVNPLIVVYDASADSTRQLPIEAGLKEAYPGECFVGVRAAGFTREGKVVVESGPHQGDWAPPQPDCTSERAFWLVRKDQSLERLPAFEPVRYASRSPQPR